MAPTIATVPKPAKSEIRQIDLRGFPFSLEDLRVCSEELRVSGDVSIIRDTRVVHPDPVAQTNPVPEGQPPFTIQLMRGTAIRIQPDGRDSYIELQLSEGDVLRIFDGKLSFPIDLT